MIDMSSSIIEHVFRNRKQSFINALEQAISNVNRDLYTEQMFYDSTSAFFIPDRVCEIISQSMKNEQEQYISVLELRIQSLEKCLGTKNLQILESIGDRMLKNVDEDPIEKQQCHLDLQNQIKIMNNQLNQVSDIKVKCNDTKIIISNHADEIRNLFSSFSHILKKAHIYSNRTINVTCELYKRQKETIHHRTMTVRRLQAENEDLKSQSAHFEEALREKAAKRLARTMPAVHLIREVEEQEGISARDILPLIQEGKEYRRLQKVMNNADIASRLDLLEQLISKIKTLTHAPSIEIIPSLIQRQNENLDEYFKIKQVVSDAHEIQVLKAIAEEATKELGSDFHEVKVQLDHLQSLKKELVNLLENEDIVGQVTDLIRNNKEFIALKTAFEQASSIKKSPTEIIREYTNLKNRERLMNAQLHGQTDPLLLIEEQNRLILALKEKTHSNTNDELVSKVSCFQKIENIPDFENIENFMKEAGVNTIQEAEKVVKSLLDYSKNTFILLGVKNREAAIQEITKMTNEKKEVITKLAESIDFENELFTHLACHSKESALSTVQKLTDKASRSEKAANDNKKLKLRLVRIAEIAECTQEEIENKVKEAILEQKRIQQIEKQTPNWSDSLRNMDEICRLLKTPPNSLVKKINEIVQTFDNIENHFGGGLIDVSIDQATILLGEENILTGIRKIVHDNSYLNQFYKNISSIVGEQSKAKIEKIIEYAIKEVKEYKSKGLSNPTDISLSLQKYHKMETEVNSIIDKAHAVGYIDDNITGAVECLITEATELEKQSHLNVMQKELTSLRTLHEKERLSADKLRKQHEQRISELQSRLMQTASINASIISETNSINL